MHYETPYVNYTIPGDFSQAVLDEGDVVFKDELLPPTSPSPPMLTPQTPAWICTPSVWKHPVPSSLPPVLSSLA